MEFWNDIVTRKSWEVLKKLNKQLDFVVIGGWGIFLWTHAMKSKDVDVILAKWDDLEVIKKRFEVRKNNRLKKYEIVISDIDVDIYIPHYSHLVIPCEDLLTMKTIREGFKVLKPEPLMILKQQAFIDRKDSIKGQKDRVDLLSLLISNAIDFNEYKRLINQYKILHFRDDLIKMIQTAKEEFTYLNITNLRDIKKLKKRWIEQLHTNASIIG